MRGALALVVALVAAVGLGVIGRPGEAQQAHPPAAALSAPAAQAQSGSTTGGALSAPVTEAQKAPAAAPHLEPLLALPPDELAALLNDPEATHRQVQQHLQAAAEAAARTELAVHGVVLDDPAALERALTAARAARPQ